MVRSIYSRVNVRQRTCVARGMCGRGHAWWGRGLSEELQVVGTHLIGMFSCFYIYVYMECQ